MILETFTEFVKISFKRWQFILVVATSLTRKNLAVVNLKMHGRISKIARILDNKL
jgi:hypothetical protein